MITNRITPTTVVVIQVTTTVVVLVGRLVVICDGFIVQSFLLPYPTTALN